jgi:hypothetical protein
MRVRICGALDHDFSVVGELDGQGTLHQLHRLLQPLRVGLLERSQLPTELVELFLACGLPVAHLQAL